MNDIQPVICLTCFLECYIKFAYKVFTALGIKSFTYICPYTRPTTAIRLAKVKLLFPKMLSRAMKYRL